MPGRIAPGSRARTRPASLAAHRAAAARAPRVDRCPTSSLQGRSRRYPRAGASARAGRRAPRRTPARTPPRCRRPRPGPPGLRRSAPPAGRSRVAWTAAPRSRPAPARATRARPRGRARAARGTRTPRGACSRSAAAPGCRRGRRAAWPSSDQPQPGERAGVAVGGRAQAGADAAGALDVGQREAGVGLVPDLRRDLVPPLVALEVRLLLRAAEQQPRRARPADAVAEHEVQAPADLVDEVVHVGLVAAVVVAREE